MYDWEPYDYCQAQGNATRQALVLGGEAALWGEAVNGANVEAATFMAAAVVAERLWSPRTTLDVADARRRLGAMRAVMRGRPRRVSRSTISSCSLSDAHMNAHIEVVVAFLVVNFFGFLVITRHHGDLQVRDLVEMNPTDLPELSKPKCLKSNRGKTKN